MIALKLDRQDNSAVVRLPKEALERLNVAAGDTIYLIETDDGYRLIGRDPAFEEQMKVARRIMRERHDVLRQLAK